MATYDPDDPDVRRFVDRAFRVLASVTTNKLALFDAASRTIVGDSAPLCWAGYDLLMQCRMEPDHYVAVGTDDSTGYRTFLGPRADWSPPAWVLRGEAG
ncbi:MAG: hypothetical protein U1E53_31005 [Dongiaceae bacterium]